MSSADYSVFADITVLTDYCCVYLDEDGDAEYILEEIHDDEGGRIAISKKGGREFSRRLANRQRLFKFLFDQSSKYLKEYEEEEAETKFKAEVVNKVDLEQAVPFDLNIALMPDIEALRDYVDEIGLKKFRSEVDDFKKEAQQRQKRLETIVIDERFDRGGRGVFELRMAIGSIVNDDCQVDSLIDAVFWEQTGGGVVLIRHENNAYQEQSQLNHQIKTTTQTELRILSPKEAKSNLN